MDKKETFLTILLVASTVINLVLGWQSVTNSDVKKEVVMLKQEMVQSKVELKNLTEQVTLLRTKVDCLFSPKVAAGGSITPEAVLKEGEIR